MIIFINCLSQVDHIYFKLWEGNENRNYFFFISKENIDQNAFSTVLN